MNNIINLNRFRKQKKRADDKTRAVENRAKSGRMRLNKNEDTKAQDDFTRHVDGHQREED